MKSESFPVCLSVVLALAFFLPLSSEAAVDFTREIRPLLEQHCVKCHGPEKQKGGLRFDTKEGAFKRGESGEKAIFRDMPIKARSSNLFPQRMMPSGCPRKAIRCRRCRSIS
jgi:hypothetical protein